MAERDFQAFPRFSLALKRGALAAPVLLFSGFAVLLVLRGLLPMQYWGGNAGTGTVTLANAPARYLLAVILLPFYETIVGQFLPLEILRKLKAPVVLSCVVSGLLFGLGHYANGGVAHGVSGTVIGILLAVVYTRSRQDGVICAFTTSFVAHALNNFALLYVAYNVPALANL